MTEQFRLRACILAIGDEIVSGLTTDTNSGYLAQMLRGIGVPVVGFMTVADDEQAIVEALERATADAELVVSTGGLGPTIDDLTTASMAAFAGVPLELHEPSLQRIEERFRAMGFEMPENNRKQALLPRGAEVILNPGGTAPGFALTVPTPQGERYLISLPGVPREMRRMAEETVLPWVGERTGAAHIGSQVFSTFGLTESRMDEMLAGVVAAGEARLSFRAAFPRLQARVAVAANSAEEVESRLKTLEDRIRERLGDHLYAVGDEGLEETVGRLLRDRGLTVAVAESCTGGLIGHRLTDVPGSSGYFLLGVVAYANEMKESLLNVSRDTLVSHGAVSEQTVREMARGVRAAAGASLGLATSGVAGPGGGSAEKPVGTVCIGLAWEGGEWSIEYRLGERTRGWIKEMTAQRALDHLRRHLLAIQGTGG